MVEVVVCHDYDAQQTDELTIRVGEIITDVVKIDDGWLEGVLRGKRALFPDNFVKERTKPDITVDQSAKPTVNGIPTNPDLQNKKVRVVYSYEPQNADELKLNVNDIIDLIAEDEEGWYRGKIGEKIGVFPSNFVEVIPDSIRQNRAIVTQKSTTNMSSTEKSRPEVSKNLPASEKPTDTTDIPQNGTLLNRAPTLPPKMRRDKKSVGRAKVIYSYTALNDDELSLSVGAIVNVINRNLEDDGWWQGELDGKIGVFPDNFVELLPSNPVSRDKGEVDNQDKKILRPPPPDPSKIRAFLKSKEEKQNSLTELKPKPSMERTSSKPQLNKKPVDPNLIAQTDDQKVQQKISKEASSSSSLDSVVAEPKLTHLTVNRVKVPNRRPPSNVVSKLYDEGASNSPAIVNHQKISDEIKSDELPKTGKVIQTQKSLSEQKTRENVESHPPPKGTRPPLPPLFLRKEEPKPVQPSGSGKAVVTTPDSFKPSCSTSHNKSFPLMPPTVAKEPLPLQEPSSSSLRDVPNLSHSSKPSHLPAKPHNKVLPPTPTATKEIQSRLEPAADLQQEILRLKGEFEALRFQHIKETTELLDQIEEERLAKTRIAHQIEQLKKFTIEKYGSS